MSAAAEDESVIGADAEIVHHEAAVADREIIGDELAGISERLCRHQIVRYWHYASADARFELVQQRIAREHAITRAHEAPARVNRYA